MRYSKIWVFVSIKHIHKEKIYADSGACFKTLSFTIFYAFTWVCSVLFCERGALRSVVRGFLSWRNRRDLLVPFRWRGVGVSVVVSLVSVFVDDAPVLLRWLWYICSQGWAFIQFVQVFACCVSSGYLIVRFPPYCSQEICVVKEGKLFLCLDPVRHQVRYYPRDCTVFLGRPEVQSWSHCPFRWNGQFWHWDSNQCSLFPKSIATTRKRGRLTPGVANNHPFATSICGSTASKPHAWEN